jgi:cell division protein FtsN
MISKRQLFAFVAFIAIATASFASGNGAASMDFLNIGVSARIAATGEAFAALSDGAIAAYYNPAGLTAADNYQIAAMHSEWYQDLRYEYLGLAIPTSLNGNLGASFSYLSLGKIAGYSSSNLATGDIAAFDWSLGVAYGHRVWRSLSLGVGAKVVNEKLDDLSAFGYAADLGAQYRARKIGIGVALVNLGPKVKYETASASLPTKIESGIAYYPFGNELAIMTGAGIPFHGEPSLKAGLEYAYSGLLFVRGGFDSAKRDDKRGGISVGAGFMISRHSLDYAYNVNDALGGTHQFSFVVRFGGIRSFDLSDGREPEYYADLNEPSHPLQADPPPAKQAIPDAIVSTETTSTVSDGQNSLNSQTPPTSAASAEQLPAGGVQPSGQVAPIESQQVETAQPQSPAEPTTPIPAITAPASEGSAAVDRSATEMRASRRTSSGRSKQAYLVCAGRYGIRADAEKHKEALEKFGYSPKVEMVGQDDFRVVMKKVDWRAKAEKIKKGFEKNGVSCFIEEKK